MPAMVTPAKQLEAMFEALPLKKLQGIVNPKLNPKEKHLLI
jgi:hypothetical protein